MLLAHHYWLFKKTRSSIKMPYFVTFVKTDDIDQSLHFRKFAKFEGVGRPNEADEKNLKEILFKERTYDVYRAHFTGK